MKRNDNLKNDDESKTVAVAPLRLIHSRKFFLVKTTNGFIDLFSPSPDRKENTPEDVYADEIKQHNSEDEADKVNIQTRSMTSKLIRSRSECQLDKNGSFSLSVHSQRHVRFSFARRSPSALQSRHIKSMENLKGPGYT